MNTRLHVQCQHFLCTSGCCWSCGGYHRVRWGITPAPSSHADSCFVPPMLPPAGAHHPLASPRGPLSNVSQYSCAPDVTQMGVHGLCVPAAHGLFCSTPQACLVTCCDHVTGPLHEAAWPLLHSPPPSFTTAIAYTTATSTSIAPASHLVPASAVHRGCSFFCCGLVYLLDSW
jgi:hypothetical protein